MIQVDRDESLTVDILHRKTEDGAGEITIIEALYFMLK